jgi:hypothetical protein
MTKRTKMWVASGAAAAVLVGGAAYYYSKKSNEAAKTPAALPSGAPVSTFMPGKAYKFAAMLPSNINDTTALEKALDDAGWANVNILFFAGTGDASPFPIAANGYVAQGTWNGSTSSPVPNGVVALTA